MDLESATVQKALSKKFPRKRCFKEVDDSVGDPVSRTEPLKIPRTTTESSSAALPYAPSQCTGGPERHAGEYQLGRLRSLSPGSHHDPYANGSGTRPTDLRHCGFGSQMRPSDKALLASRSPPDQTAGDRLSHRADHFPAAVLTAQQYLASGGPLLRRGDRNIDIKSLNAIQSSYLPEHDVPTVHSYFQIARTNMSQSASFFPRPNTNPNDAQPYDSSSTTVAPTKSLPETPEKRYRSPDAQRFHPHIRQMNDQFRKRSYLAPLCDLPCSSPVNYDVSSAATNEAANLSPLCLRTASTVIIEAVASRGSPCALRRQRGDPESEGDQRCRHFSVNSSPSSSKSSTDSSCSRRPMTLKQRYKNEFQSAHRDLLGGSSVPSSSPVLGEPPELIRISSDDGDYADGDYDNDSQSDSEGNNAALDDSRAMHREEVPDTSGMSVDEILSLIRLPALIDFTADLECVKSYLEPHQIGHINHLIKCYADAVFTITVPPSVLESKAFSGIDYLDIHMSGVLQIYCIMFKSEDFIALNVTDQVTLLQSCVLPAHMALGFPLYKPEKHAWAIPSSIGSGGSFTYGIYNMLQILPKSEVSRLVALHETSHKLKIDWTISVLLLFIFMFTPIKRKIFDMDNIENIRNTYVQMLYKYLDWKCGPQNAPRVFPEILKLMDAILRLCQDLEDFELWLKEEEVEIVQSRIKCFSLQGVSPFDTGSSDEHSLSGDETPMECVTFAGIHSKMSSVLLKSCSIPPSEAGSSDSEILFRIPFKTPPRSMFVDSFETSELTANRIHQF